MRKSVSLSLLALFSLVSVAACVANPADPHPVNVEVSDLYNELTTPILVEKSKTVVVKVEPFAKEVLPITNTLSRIDSNDLKRSAIIDFCEQYQHVREITNNDSPEIRKFLDPFGFRNAPWCAAFVYAGFQHAGVPSVKSALAAHFAPNNRTFYSQNTNYSGLERAEKGDTYFFWSKKQRRINHVGFFALQPTRSGNWIHGWEGNTTVRNEADKQGVSYKVRTKAMIWKASDWVTNKTLLI